MSAERAPRGTAIRDGSRATATRLGPAFSLLGLDPASAEVNLAERATGLANLLRTHPVGDRSWEVRLRQMHPGIQGGHGAARHGSDGIAAGRWVPAGPRGRTGTGSDAGGQNGAVSESAGGFTGAGQSGRQPPAAQTQSDNGRFWWGYPRYWLGQALVWFGYGVVVCMTAYSDRAPARWHHFVLGNLEACALGILFSHVIRLCSHFGQWTRRGWSASIGQVLLLSLGYGCACVWLGMDGRPPPPVEHPPPPMFEDGMGFPLLTGAPPPAYELLREDPHHRPIYLELLRGTLVMLAWSGIYLGYGSQRQLRLAQLDRARLDASAKEAQLRALQNQLNPHFLFNGLNTIRALIEEDAGKARQAVTSLSDLLRALLRASENDLVPLGQELKTLEAYLHIEKCRYEERLRVEMDVDPKALGLLVPPFVLQTLVENAVKHGIATQPQGGLLSCKVRVGADHLWVRVANAGTLQVPGAGAGVGLANARERLRLLFDETAALSLFSPSEGLVIAELRLPKVRTLP